MLESSKQTIHFFSVCKFWLKSRFPGMQTFLTDSYKYAVELKQSVASWSNEQKEIPLC